jgi:glucokinase
MEGERFPAKKNEILDGVPGDERVVALDVGGTRIKYALAAADGELEEVGSTPTPQAADVLGVEQAIFETIESLRKKAGERDVRIRAIGIGIPGVVDEDRGIGVFSANLGWHDYPVADVLKRRTEIPVYVGHDVRLAALGEARVGAAVDIDDFVFLALGTGIGAAVFTRGKPLRGARGAAGELGHLRVARDAPRCRCGRTGCLEAIAGGGAIRRRYAESDPGPLPTLEEIARRWREGEERATRVWTEGISALAAGLAHCALLFDPERFVLGGGMIHLRDQLLSPLRQALGEEMRGWATPAIVAAELGSLAGCTGAGIIAWQDAPTRGSG